MAEKVKNMLKNNMVLCVLVLVAIGLTSVVFAADFKVKGGKIKDAAIFGTWTSQDSESNALAAGETYKAGSDGFILGSCSTYTTIACLADSSSTPTTTVISTTAGHANSKMAITAPIKKDDYFQITLSGGGGGTATIYWLPIGNGECVKQ
jgi:hypothetical protein